MSLFTGDNLPSTTITLIEDVFEMGVYEDAAGGITDVVLAHRHTPVDPPDSIRYIKVPARLVTPDLSVDAMLHCRDCGMVGRVLGGRWLPDDRPVHPAARSVLTYNDILGGQQ